MSKINQEPLLTVSPAVGSYKITTDVRIDSGYTGVSWDVNPATLVDYWRDQGVTGVSSTSFNNMVDPNAVGGVTYK